MESAAVFIVEGVYELTGLDGLHVVGHTAEPWVDFRIGESIRLIRPDGTEAEAAVTSVASSSPSGAHMVGIQIDRPDRSEVPLGTKVFRKSET